MNYLSSHLTQRCSGLLALMLGVLAPVASAQLFSRAEIQAGRGGLRDTLALDEAETAAAVNGTFAFSNPDQPSRVLTLTGEARARADFGSIGAFASATINNPFLDPEGAYDAPPQEFLVIGEAGFVDEIIFTRPAGDETEGYTATFTFTVDGSTTGRFAVGGVLFVLNSETEAFEVVGPGTITSQPHVIEWDTPAELVTSLQSQFYVDLEATPFVEGEPISGSADFFNTVVLNGITVNDPTGKPVRDFKVEGFSGTQYANVISKPDITVLKVDTEAAQLTFTSVDGRRYAVESKDNLSAIDWSPVTGATNLSGTGNPITISDPLAGSLPQRFYRVAVLD